MGVLWLFVSGVVGLFLLLRGRSGVRRATTEPMRWSEIYRSGMDHTGPDITRTKRWTKESPPDYYDLLGVTPQTSPQQVERQYRRRAAQLHPDRFFQDPLKRAQAERDLRALNEAISVLRDPDHRASYDATYDPKPIHSRILRGSQTSH